MPTPKLLTRLLPVLGGLLGLIANIASAADQHVIAISIDGLRPEIYLHPEQEGVKMPNLVRLRDAGVAAERMIGVFPTVTYPSHTSLATGVRPATHGIVNNFKRGSLDWYLEEKDIHAETLWQAAEKAGRRTALITWPATYGAKVSWLIPENLSFGIPDVPGAIRKGATPGLMEELSGRVGQFDIPSFDNEDGGEKLDRMTTAYAVEVFKRHQPALMMLHFLDTDHMEHAHGPRSAEARRSFENVDAEIGRIMQAVEESGVKDKTNIVIVGDHGFVPTYTGINLSQILVELGYAEMKDKRVQTKVIDTMALGGSGAFYAQPGAKPEDVQEFLRRFEAHLAQKYRNLLEFIPQKEVERLGGYPGAVGAFVVSTPGYMVVETPAPYLTMPLPMMAGMHGYHPDMPQMATGFIASGPAFRPSTVVPTIRMIDVAPTLAAVLGIQLPKAEGIVAAGLLNTATPKGTNFLGFKMGQDDKK